MDWESRPPIVDGWYWWRQGPKYEGTIVFVSGHFTHPPVSAGGQWQGPLAPDNGGTHTPLTEAVVRAARQLEDAAAGLKVLGESLRDGR